MSMQLWNIRIALLAVLILVLPSDSTPEKPVRVRHLEGLVHGFLALRTPDGETLADGDLIKTRRLVT